MSWEFIQYFPETKKMYDLNLEQELTMLDSNSNTLYDPSPCFGSAEEDAHVLSDYKANGNAWYEAEMIMVVWDNYVKNLQCHYFISQTQYAVGLIKPNALDIEFMAGILLSQSDNKLYKNHLQLTVSICGALEQHRTESTKPINTKSLKKSLKQIKAWNENNLDSPIINHQIIFPYNISGGHWALCVLTCHFTSNVLKNVKCYVYNSEPDCGGIRLSDFSAQQVEQLFSEIFNTKVVLTNDFNRESIRQQADGNACGPITAENGKYFLDTNENDDILKETYPEGAIKLRKLQIHEVNREEFYKKQLHNQPVSFQPINLPTNVFDFQEWFKQGIVALEPEKLSALKQDINNIEKNGGHDTDIAILLKKIIIANKDIFQKDDKNHCFENLFIYEESEWKFKNDQIDTLMYISKFLEKDCWRQQRSKPTASSVQKFELTPEEREQEDFLQLDKIEGLLNKLLDEESDEINYLYNLQKVGEYIEQISWKETDAKCVRNKHGYRNRYKDKGNKKNTKGAKINFEAIAHMKELAKSIEFKWLLEDVPFIKQGLKNLKEKIVIAKSANLSEQKDVYDNLSLVASFYHDNRCLERITSILNTYDESFAHCNLSNIINRYHLAYFFSLIGELAKELSDIVKPEHSAEEDKKNPLRSLFAKLGHFRQRIKDKPWIVYKNNVTQFLWMKMCFEEELPLLKELINNLIELLRLNKIEELRDNYLELAKIIENDKKDQIKKLTKILSYGGHKDSLEKKITRIKNKIKKCDEVSQKTLREQTLKIKIENLKQQINMQGLECNKDLETCANALDSTILKDKVASQIKLLSNYCSIEMLKNSDMAPAAIALVIAIKRAHANIEEVQPDQRKLEILKNILKKKLPAIQNVIQKYEKILKPHINSSVDMEEYFYGIIMFIKKHGKVQLLDIKHKINILESKLVNLKDENLLNEDSELKYLETKKEEIEVIIRKYKKKNNNTPKRIKIGENAKEHEKVILSMINEGEFLHHIHTYINKALFDKNEKKYNKLVMAEKFSFGIYGQNFKVMKDEHTDELNVNLIPNSLLFTDCFKVMQIRHKQIAHNMFDCDEKAVHATVEQQIIPWLKDLKYMARLFTKQREYVIEEIANITPADNRLLVKMNVLATEGKDILFIYHSLVSFNRFLRSKDALETYAKLLTMIPSNIEPELATEIHWQGSLAYRNLDDFKSCIGCLEQALKFTELISNTSIKGFKKSSIYCDLGIAYTEIDNMDMAENYLKKVTTTSIESVPKQIIAANILLAQIELVRGNNEVGIAILELNFIKYFDQIVGFSKIMAISLLNQLASVYLDQFEIENTQDCLEFSETILNKYFSNLIVEQGQSVVYLKSIVYSNLICFKALSAIVNNEESQLKEFYVEAIEMHKYKQSILYLNKKLAKNIENPLIILALLTKTKNDEVNDFLSNLHLDEKDIQSNIKQIDIYIKRLKRKILAYSSIERKNKSKVAVGKIHNTYTKELVALSNELMTVIQFLALTNFLIANYDEAQKFMKMHLLFHMLVDYLKFKFNEIRLKRPNKKLEKQMQLWANETQIDMKELSEFTNNQLKGYRSIKNINSQELPKSGIIKKYKNAQDDLSATENLIDEFEKNLILANYYEKNETYMQIKIKNHKNLRIHRWIGSDKYGNLVLKEQSFPLAPQAATKPAKSSPPMDNHFDSKQLFRGIFSSSELNDVLKKYIGTDKCLPTKNKALRCAAANGVLEDVKFLLKYGAEINAQDNNPKSLKTALHHAFRNNHQHIVKYLLSEKADPDILDADHKRYDFVGSPKNSTPMLQH